MFTRWSDAKTAKSPGELTAPALPDILPRAAPPAVIIAQPHLHATAGAPPPLPAMPRQSPQQPEAASMSDAGNHSVIGQDLTIEGQSITIRCRGALHINGNIQAELHSQTLVVGESGKIEGAVWAESVDVRGKVSGTIMGARVVLHPTAEVEGDIHAKSLSVVDGASFEGRSRRVTDAAAIAPRLDSFAPMIDPGAQPPQVPTPRAMPALVNGSS